VPIASPTDEAFDGLDIDDLQGFMLAITRYAKFASLLLVQELARKDRGEQERVGVLRGRASVGGRGGRFNDDKILNLPIESFVHEYRGRLLPAPCVFIDPLDILVARESVSYCWLKRELTHLNIGHVTITGMWWKHRGCMHPIAAFKTLALAENAKLGRD
jgi:hypothetical protein